MRQSKKHLKKKGTVSISHPPLTPFSLVPSPAPLRLLGSSREPGLGDLGPAPLCLGSSGSVVLPP